MSQFLLKLVAYNWDMNSCNCIILYVHTAVCNFYKALIPIEKRIYFLTESGPVKWPLEQLCVINGYKVLEDDSNVQLQNMNIICYMCIKLIQPLKYL